MCAVFVFDVQPQAAMRCSLEVIEWRDHLPVSAQRRSRDKHSCCRASQLSGLLRILALAPRPT
eukprot:10326773-Alexandrium_andersonii.AAC.1